MIRKFFGLVFVLALIGCGGPALDTPEKKLIAAEAAMQGQLQTINRLIDAGIINSSNAEQVQAGRESSTAALLAARRAFDAGLPTSTALIGAANSAVLNLGKTLDLLEAN